MRVGKLISALLVALVTLFSCTLDDNFRSGVSGEGTGSRRTDDRLPTPEVRHVMVMVAAGFNSLSSYIKDDMNELAQGYLPEGTSRSQDVLLVLSRFPQNFGGYSTPTPVTLYRLYAGPDGAAVRDTLYQWDPSVHLCDASTIREALELIADRFPAKGYGVVFSSHASGWLPSGYYNDPAAYESAHGGEEIPDEGIFSARSLRARQEVFPPISAYPAVKSIGQDRDGTQSIEMELGQLAGAIPMHLEYLLFDACLNGCVEVAYAFKDVADVVGFSPTEVLANGFDYLKLARHLLRPELDPVAVCKDYFAFYDAQTGSNRSATITVVAPARMDALAAVCRQLFDKYREQIQVLPGAKVQGYFRFNRHYFYDLRDVLVQAGITEEETAQLDQALSECILYKASTPQFIGMSMLRVSGLSMYLPSMGTPLLDNFYKEQIAWNQVTELVQ